LTMKLRRRGGSHVSSSEATVPGPTPASLFSLNKMLLAADKNPKILGPYSNKMDILILGDGDLSFARSLAFSLGGDRIIATCFDSMAEFRDKYRASVRNIEELKQLGVRGLYFGVDATRLEEQKWLNDPKNLAVRQQFHRIVFNFPHAGQSEDGIVSGGNIPQHQVVRRNQKLVQEFFISAAPWLLPNGVGQIHVALRTSTHYQQWQIEELACNAGLVLKKKVFFALLHLSASFVILSCRDAQ